MNWISVYKTAPNDGQKVFVSFRDEIIIAKFLRGITQEQREQMKAEIIEDPDEMGWCESVGWESYKRSDCYKKCDECWNNLTPYAWEIVNDGHITFGQNIEFWCEVFELPEARKVEAKHKQRIIEQLKPYPIGI